MSAANVVLPTSLFSPKEQEQVQELIQKFSTQQLQWLAGYLTGLQHSNQQLLQLINRIPVTQESITTEPLAGQDSITILFGSKSGNSKKVAKNLHDKLIARGFTASLQDMNQYQPARLKEEKWLFVVVSTHGEGDPPPAAEDLHAFINGRKAPALKDTRYAVLALGDKSYASYCQTGKDFDARLSALQANRILERADADVDYEDTAESWIEAVLAKVQESFSSSPVKQSSPATLSSGNGAATTKTAVSYSRKNPFTATILEKVQLNGRGSAKETYHVEISLENSGLNYLPGDTVGLWVENEPSLVEGLIAYKNWDPNTIIIHKDTPYTLFDFFRQKAELTTISGSFLTSYIAFINDPADAHALINILGDKQELGAFVYGRDIWDVLQQFPAAITVEDLCSILLPLQPRLYSIASSIQAHPEEVHITVARVKYQHKNRIHRGVASNYIADILEPGKEIKLFIESNESFRLPESQGTPVIMVGPGTGIAPFRAFVEERSETGAEGNNWLFFGDQHFSTDFLYQTEWQRFIKQGSLTRMNTAFSRDGKNKIYVQHRMQQHAAELFKWLENGAHFYVCGDAKRMAKDVKQTLVDIVQQEGKLSEEAAVDYVKQLIKKGRYQEDVY
ncbi:assimilatory sulfite reductase (NADPH) flavoprotein subunit [Flavihumibacter fluvii]|uniref:assimilatory sulfite reductase (NADPH) flavoprotein subunit n=1 Tax=Flavihumibacter fluvii TaxID=2838157 RepID=UPI001BDE39D5|nr:assimilatory sulfite reductase (NADPH) flavoprotein subunit [Flavihumibacter fluvii]ULQ53824.1 assimilatory sulfite reductase (NADPH) flavoprotein subunit [Flavihumibacter fluvii]